ncbi:MAG: rhodanese-like domain-containing protein [Rhodospirillales bacterium]|nr:rhodanese-like domain-containing protein [Rhodospirillales bacterium]
MSIKEIDPRTLQQWIAEGSAILVDVREPHEHAQEHIPEAHHMPLSRFMPDSLPAHEEKIVVYHCATGARTGTYGMHLSAAVPSASDVYHLAGGIMSWKMAGLGTKGAGAGSGPFPWMRF